MCRRLRNPAPPARIDWRVFLVAAGCTPVMLAVAGAVLAKILR